MTNANLETRFPNGFDPHDPATHAEWYQPAEPVSVPSRETLRRRVFCVAMGIMLVVTAIVIVLDAPAAAERAQEYERWLCHSGRDCTGFSPDV